MKLIAVDDLLKRLNGAFSWDQLKTLRKRHGLFVHAIPLGRVTTKKGGAARYVPVESVDYLKRILTLRNEGRSYVEIKNELREETANLKELILDAYRKQLYIRPSDLAYAENVVRKIEKEADSFGIKAFTQSPDKVYQTLLSLYEQEKDKTRKIALRNLVIHFARYLRAIIKSHKR